ncbi:MAG: hypothetical protein HY847_19745 [Betaproteobacteria bacterium]|nr:hypothetical protein [Betaproteobacteria bacterium]
MQVELLKHHTHAKTSHAPGALIALDDDLAKWLINAGIARVPVQMTVHKPVPRFEEKSK